MKLPALLLVTAVLTQLAPCSGANILALFVFPSPSHANMLNPILRELLANGHQLTVLSNYHLPTNTANYTRIDITPKFDVWAAASRHMQSNISYDQHKLGPVQMIELINNITLSCTDYVLAHPNVQQLLHNSTEQRFQLVLVEEFYQQAFLMFAHQFRAPLVSISTLDYSQHFNEMFGVFGAWSHVPHIRLLVGDHMSFWERLQNVGLSLVDYYIRRFDYMPKHQALADKYFAHLPAPRPTVEQLNHNISVLLLNRHSPLTTIQPTVPGLVDVGGLHIGKPKPLPNDIRAFLDAAGPDGAIFFTMGSQLKIAEMPTAQLDAILRSFQRFPHMRILWKCEDDAIATRLPSNVMVKQWMPQADILAHPKVRVFITHGGQFGMQEAIHHGVPMLGIPVFSDQPHNVAMAERAGIAIGLRFGNVTEESMSWALRELLENPRYAAAMKRATLIFRDRPQRPLELATYWIEYVLRHRGAAHLRSGALDLSWFSYMLLDVVVVCGVGLAIGVYLGYVSVKLTARTLRTRPSLAIKHLKRN